MAEENNNEVNETSNTEVQTESPDIVEKEDIKQLEEKDHFELEYFSKDEVVEKVKSIEKELDELKTTTERLKKENDESKSKYMHLQAEFENAQKRWNKSREDLRAQYTASVLKSFLSLYDSFKKALESENEAKKELLNGFYNQFMSILKSYGAEPIEVKINDPFDYSKHEALTSVEKDDVPENTILEIIQDGWKYGKDVIRYTKVVTSRKPKPPEPEPEKEEEKPEEIKEDREAPEEAKPEEKKLKEEKNSESSGQEYIT